MSAAVTGDFPLEARQAIRTGDGTERAHGAKIRDAWTASGVAARSGMRLDQLLAEWAQCERVLTEDNAWLLGDLSVHFDDLREALGDHGPRHAPDINRTIEYFHGVQTTRLLNSGLQPVQLECRDHPGLSTIGQSDWPLVRGDAYDVVRCLVSRRTRRQAAEALDWGSCPNTTLQAFPVYGWPH